MDQQRQLMQQMAMYSSFGSMGFGGAGGRGGGNNNNQLFQSLLGGNNNNQNQQTNNLHIKQASQLFYLSPI